MLNIIKLRLVQNVSNTSYENDKNNFKEVLSTIINGNRCSHKRNWVDQCS